MPYNVELTRKALKDMAKMPTALEQNIWEHIHALANEPRPHGYKQLKGEDAFRIRVGDYRIIYEIFDDVLLVVVIRVKHRKEAYD